jgi:hypothetical protein
VVGDYDSERKQIVLATGTYSNGGFRINLPATVDEKYLEPSIENLLEFTSSFLTEYYGMKVSDSNAKYSWVSIYGYDKSDNHVASFSYEVEYKDIAEITGHYIYVDRDVTITGLHKGIYGYSTSTTFNLSLKKGWNIMYAKYSRASDTEGDEEWTNDAPSGIKWWVTYYGDRY